jgi:hypothetical protein
MLGCSPSANVCPPALAPFCPHPGPPPARPRCSPTSDKVEVPNIAGASEHRSAPREATRGIPDVCHRHTACLFTAKAPVKHTALANLQFSAKNLTNCSVTRGDGRRRLGEAAAPAHRAVETSGPCGGDSVGDDGEAPEEFAMDETRGVKRCLPGVVELGPRHLCSLRTPARPRTTLQRPNPTSDQNRQ